MTESVLKCHGPRPLSPESSLLHSSVRYSFSTESPFQAVKQRKAPVRPVHFCQNQGLD